MRGGSWETDLEDALGQGRRGEAWVSRRRSGQSHCVCVCVCVWRCGGEFSHTAQQFPQNQAASRQPYSFRSAAAQGTGPEIGLLDPRLGITMAQKRRRLAGCAGGRGVEGWDGPPGGEACLGLQPLSPLGQLWSSAGLTWLRADIPGERGACCLWEEVRLENAFLGVGGTSSILSLTESSTTRGRGGGAIVKLVPHRGPGNTWLQTHETVKTTGFGHAGPRPCCTPSPLLFSFLSSRLFRSFSRCLP